MSCDIPLPSMAWKLSKKSCSALRSWFTYTYTLIITNLLPNSLLGVQDGGLETGPCFLSGRGRRAGVDVVAGVDDPIVGDFGVEAEGLDMEVYLVSGRG